MIRLSLAVLVLGLLTHSSAQAHRMLATCKITGKELLVEVYYEDDSPAAEAKIQIRQGETILLEGKADDTGKWKAQLPSPGEYLLRASHYGHVALQPFTVPGADSPVELSLTTPKEPVGIRWAAISAGLAVIVGLFAGIWIVWRGKKLPPPNGADG